MQLSVIIPVFNRRKYIMDTLASLRSQNGIQYEMIIYDDGSTDGTRDILAGINDPFIRVIYGAENMGAAEARNLAVEHASADWICPFDSDDIMDQDSLASYFNWVTSQKNAQWGSCGLRIITADGSPTGMFMSGPWDFVRQMGTNMVCHGMSLFTKDLFFKQGGYDKNLRVGQDYEMFLRFQEIADPVFYGKVCYSYRRHESNSNNAGHGEANSDHKRLHDAVHDVVRKRYKALEQSGATTRQQQMMESLRFLDAVVARDAQSIVKSALLLDKMGVDSLWKDQTMAQLYQSNARWADAFNLYAKRLEQMTLPPAYTSDQLLKIMGAALTLAEKVCPEHLTVIKAMARQIMPYLGAQDIKKMQELILGGYKS